MQFPEIHTMINFIGEFMRLILAVIFVISCFCCPVFSEGASAPSAVTEDYFKKLSPQEEQAITYIVTTLGTRTALGLVIYRTALDKAGDQMADVHPLRFWKEVLMNPKLRDSLKHIKGIVRKQFIDGFVKGFQDSQKKGVMLEEYTADFSKTVGIPKEQMDQYVKDQDWEAMMKAFFAWAENQKS